MTRTKPEKMPKTAKKRWTEVQVDWRDIKYEIDAAGHGMKIATKKTIARRLGLSIDQIHSALRSEFGPAKTINKREFRTKADKESYERNRRIAYLVAEQKEKMKQTGEGERELATWRVLDLLQDWGVDEATECSESTINRILAEEMGYRRPIARVRHEASYALQEVQVDFSFSKYFSIDTYNEQLGDYMMKASKKLLRYKEGDKRMRPMIGVILDSYSRLRFHACLPASGESASNTVAFLIDFFQREDDELLLRHVPWMFKMDNGPLAKSREGQSFFTSIDRPVQTSKPGEKTGIGKAERSWQLIWQWEMQVASEIGIGNSIPLSIYNEQLLAECVRQQQLRHPFFGAKTCADMYQQSILAQQPRPEVIGADLTDAVYTHLERTVGQDQIISINNEKFEVPVMADDHHHTTGKRIRVLIHKDGRMVGELIDRNAKTFEIRPFVAHRTGTFRLHTETAGQQIGKLLNQGSSITEELRRAASITIRQKEEHFQGPRRLMAKADELEIKTPFAGKIQPKPVDEVCISKFEALTFVAELLKQTDLEMNDQLHDYFNDFVTQVQLNKPTIRNEVQNLISILNNYQTGT